ncbi:conserved hypothetical protein [Talaromyces marneffei ATCC 18224]|uniref:Uncharacterized protein n=1 Tax=Talaromyces marneffei (strain ATCC 18224 / CBS 334.59 / QM 7333) TaxID=441960 RepID=B6Q8P5_TALMQ|nr:conserved hypothetical protein [Talaromyces marneffei ATCC 18224]
MPIKLPKGFARRKSSGNALDEVEQAPESSFRVFERPNGLNKGRALTNGEGRYYRPATAESDNIFAGIEKPLPHNRYIPVDEQTMLRLLTYFARASGGTNNSASTGLYDSSSSARYSSSSTLPSSTDIPVHNDLSRGVHDLPVPPVPESPSVFSLRAAGRTFSFGTRPLRTSTPTSQQQQQQQQQQQACQQTTASPSTSRDRATTASSANTAIPPKLLDSDLSIRGAGDDDDGFGSMFENFGKRKSAILLDSSKSVLSPALPSNYPSYSNNMQSGVQSKNHPAPNQNERGVPLAPIVTDRRQAVEPSPYSWDSQTSTNALMHGDTDNNRHEGRTATLPPSQSMTSTKSAALESPDSYDSDDSPSFIADNDDAEIVRQSILMTTRSPQPPASTSPQPNTNEKTPLFESDEIISSAQLASQYEDHVASAPTTQNKVMTPAQFERYRQQREMTRRLSTGSKSEASEAGNDYEDEDEDEDEAEKTREAARQRRKQEAHLSVYRQQMMKVIGQQAPPQSSGSQSLRPISENGSISTPNLLSRSSMLGLPTIPQESGKSDGEDDEDVPLAILAAHGFPHKNRPPTRLNASSSNPNLRVSYSGSSPGPSTDNAADPRASLPVFARNLPRDPYFGAAIVNPSHRESLALGGGTPALGTSPSSTSLPPGGLVGVIANEERARAMRRGSPNAQAQATGISRPYSVANIAQMNAPGPWNGPTGLPQYQQPQVMTPGEQAQLQISQQMTEIMQVQVQMMQQMMQMQSLSPGQQPPQINPNFLSALGQPANSAQRPMSMASSFHLLANPPQVNQRTLSMLDPNMSRWNLNRPASIHPDAMGRPMTPQGGHGYAPSIAPSERSNIGMASRYRPVSMAVQEQQMPRSSTFTSSLKPWNNENPRPISVSPSNLQPRDRKSTSLATVTVQPVDGTSRDSLSGKQNVKNSLPDEDEDEAWTELMKKREKKKSSWKLKKENSTLGDLLHIVH